MIGRGILQCCRWVLLLAGFAPAWIPVPAAAVSPVRLEGDVVFALGFPRAELHDQIRETGLGGHANLLVGHDGIPVFAGFSIGALGYGTESRREIFSPAIPDVTVRVTTSNNIFYGHFLIRLQPPEGDFRPHLDALVGFKDFYTKTSIHDDRGGGEEPIAESKNLDDVAFSYGGGGGVRVRVYTVKIPVHEGEDTMPEDPKPEGTGPERTEPEERAYEERPLGIYLSAGAWYLLGSEAQYLKRGSIRREGGRVIYDISRSRTDMVLAQIGVSLAY